MKMEQTYSLLLLFFTLITLPLFADIPLNDNSSGFDNVNFLPWALIVLFSVGIFIFIKALKKNRNV